MLSDSDDDLQNKDIHNITINEHYAKAFQYRKEREELEKLKAKLGSDISESDLDEEETDSESAESEDEDGEELTPAVDAAILKTLARIKRKDPSIYDTGKDVFGEEQKKIGANAIFTNSNKKERDKSKPVTLRQAALDAVLNPSRSPSPEPLTHVQEQHALRNETISAFHSAVGGADEDNDDLLVPREKTQEEMEREEAEYRAFLEREVGDLKEIVSVDTVDDSIIPGEPQVEGEKKRDVDAVRKKEGASPHAMKRKPKEQEDHEFLMNYILNRGWIDKSKDHIPTYKEVTLSKTKTKGKSKAEPASDEERKGGEGDGNDIEDQFSESSFDSLNDHFETFYNFRFEEPNSSVIPSYPRNIPTLLRREDSKRKEARERRKQRKQEELERKKEEVRRLKALKMRELRRKLEKIGKEGGLLGKDETGDNEDVDVALKELDLEGDWDPEKHDQQMAGLFGAPEEGDWEDGGEVDEDGKPIWKDDIDIGDITIPDGDAVSIGSKKKDKKKKKKKKKKGERPQEDGVDVDVMDADLEVDKMEDHEEWDGTEEMRKRKVKEYMDEIYALDFNDMVGDMPTRFKYTPVAPQNYSLTPVEILMATDKELNEFMSVKKYAPYRNDARKWDTKRQQKLKEFKQRVTERLKSSDLGSSMIGESVLGEKGKKRKGKKERMKAKAVAEPVGEGQGENAGAIEEVVDGGGGTADLKALKRKHDGMGEEDLDGAPQDMPKKKRRRKHKKIGDDGHVDR